MATLNVIMGINEDIFWGEQEFMKDLDNCVAEMAKVNVYSCGPCEETYKSKGGLTRHKKSRHTDASVESLHQTSFDVNTFTQLLVNKMKKMGNDECFPDSVVEELTNYSISSEDLNHSYGYLQDIIAEFIIYSRYYCQINKENLKVLLAGKTENNHNDLTLVNVKDRGGLWKVMQDIFSCRVTL